MTLATNIHAKIRAEETIAGDLDNVVSAFADRDPIQMASGTGSGQANLKWSDTRTLVASDTETLDLNNLTDSLGRTSTFTKVKALRISAASANTNDVVIGNAASNPFRGPLDVVLAGVDLAEPTITLKPGAGVLMWYTTTGWSSANGSLDKLKIANSSSGSSVTYDIEIVGLS